MALLALVGTSALAGATPATDRAAQLFAEGRDLATLAKYPEACAKFAASYELDPGDGTEVNLADCHEHLGHLARAWQLFDHAAASSARAGNAVRSQYARDRAAALVPRLANLTIHISDGRIPRLRLTIGDRDVAPAAEIHEHFEPGDVEVVATSPERTFRTTAHAAAGKTAVVEVPELGPPADHRRRNWLIGATALGVSGAIALGVSGALGVGASHRYHDAFASGECFPTSAGDRCTARGLAMVDDAHARARLGTEVFVGGAALVGAGLVLYFLAPHPRAVEITPVGDEHSAGVSLSGRF
jgi:hypothetical protein